MPKRASRKQNRRRPDWTRTSGPQRRRRYCPFAVIAITSNSRTSLSHLVRTGQVDVSTLRIAVRRSLGTRTIHVGLWEVVAAQWQNEKPGPDAGRVVDGARRHGAPELTVSRVTPPAWSGSCWDDGDALAVGDVCGSGRWIDADRAWVITDAGVRSRVVAAAGVLAVAGGAVDY